MTERPQTPEQLEARRQMRRESRQSQTYKRFLKNLCEESGLSEADAEAAASSVLCAFEQRILQTEADHLNAQLPRKLQELLTRCERHDALPPHKFGRAELVKMVCEDLGIDDTEAEARVRAVCSAVRLQVTEGEVEKVIDELPADLRVFWRPLA